MINRWKLVAVSAPSKCHSSCCSLCLIRLSPFVSYELPSIPMAPPKHSLLRGAILDPLHTHTHTHPGSPLFWALWFHPRRLLQQLGHTPGRIFGVHHGSPSPGMQGLWVEGVLSFSLSLIHSHSLSPSLLISFIISSKTDSKKSRQMREKVTVSRQTGKLFSDHLQSKGQQRFQKGKFEIEKPFNEMCYRLDKK